jgi:hypothetical protein
MQTLPLGFPTYLFIEIPAIDGIQSWEVHLLVLLLLVWMYVIFSRGNIVNTRLWNYSVEVELCWTHFAFSVYIPMNYLK